MCFYQEHYQKLLFVNFYTIENVNRGDRWSKKDRSCKLSLWTTPYLNQGKRLCPSHYFLLPRFSDLHTNLQSSTSRVCTAPLILVHIITVCSMYILCFNTKCGKTQKHKTWDKIENFCRWGIYLSSGVLLVLASQLFLIDWSSKLEFLSVDR